MQCSYKIPKEFLSSFDLTFDGPSNDDLTLFHYMDNNFLPTCQWIYFFAGH